MSTFQELNGEDAGKRQYLLRIDERLFRLEAQNPTGRELFDLAGRNPVETFFVLLIPGMPEVVVELNERIDLVALGLEEVILVSRERRFGIKVDESKFNVEGPFITG